MSTADPQHSTKDLTQRIHQGEALFGALLVLSAAGIGVTSFKPEYGFHYWATVVPLFGGVSAFLAWSRARAHGESPGGAIRAQLFHWLGVFGALWLVFLLKTTGALQYDALGLVALTTLALATFLAGVHADWRLCGVGIVLGAIVVAGAFAQQVWAVVLVIGALVVVATLVWRRRGRAPASVSDVS